MAETHAQLAAGTAVGRYVIESLLGESGRGAVYQAFDTELGRAIALKMMNDAPADRERLMDEVQALARLSHPNVLPVYDVGTFEGHVFIATEFVAGATLRDWLRAAPRPRAEVLAVLRAAGEGLAAAHRAGLIHRDFKPDNVMVGNDGRVRVLDFGQLRSSDGYMAPEQLAGGTVDARADQFAFAIVLYEALY